MRAETNVAAAARLDRSIVALTALRGSINGTLPVAAAETLMDDIEDHLNIIGVKLKRALAIVETEIENGEMP